MLKLLFLSFTPQNHRMQSQTQPNHKQMQRLLQNHPNVNRYQFRNTNLVSEVFFYIRCKIINLQLYTILNQFFIENR